MSLAKNNFWNKNLPTQVHRHFSKTSNGPDAAVHYGMMGMYVRGSEDTIVSGRGLPAGRFKNLNIREKLDGFEATEVMLNVACWYEKNRNI